MRHLTLTWRALAAITCLAWLPICAAGDVPERVLFVGNSYLYYNDSLHNHVRRMVAETHPNLELEYKSATISGARLDQHSLDHLLDHERQRVSAPFQLVLLQGGSMEALTRSGRTGFFSTVSRMSRAIRAAGAQVALYVTPSYVSPHDGTDPAMSGKVLSMYLNAAQATEALLVAVGPAFDLAYRLNPGATLHNPRDGSHPSLLGTYLAACVVYATLLGVSPEGMEYDGFGALSKADTLFAQRTAWQAVKDFDQRAKENLP